MAHRVVAACTVDRKRAGSAPSSRAACARSSPSSASWRNRAFRADIKATSAMAKIPLVTSNKPRINNSVEMLDME